MISKKHFAFPARLNDPAIKQTGLLLTLIRVAQIAVASTLAKPVMGAISRTRRKTVH
jgi:hypothetical protein